MKIWAKLLVEQNIKKEIIFQSDEDISYFNYQMWVREICLQLDIPSPVIIPFHYKNFVKFHNTRFKQSDFIESLDYDQFILEDCKED